MKRRNLFSTVIASVLAFAWPRKAQSKTPHLSAAAQNEFHEKAAEFLAKKYGLESVVIFGYHKGEGGVAAWHGETPEADDKALDCAKWLFHKHGCATQSFIEYMKPTDSFFLVRCSKCAGYFNAAGEQSHCPHDIRTFSLMKI